MQGIDPAGLVHVLEANGEGKGAKLPRLAMDALRDDLISEGIVDVAGGVLGGDGAGLGGGGGQSRWPTLISSVGGKGCGGERPGGGTAFAL
jgi:hypothetical protein